MLAIKDQDWEWGWGTGNCDFSQYETQCVHYTALQTLCANYFEKDKKEKWF